MCKIPIFIFPKYVDFTVTLDYNKKIENSYLTKEVAEEHNLVFIPLQDKFDDAAKLAPTTYWLRDGVHPTPKGHELIKREWLKAFELIK